MDVPSNDEIAAGRQLTVTRAAGVPMISAEQYQHVGRYAGAAVMACFEQIGGLERMRAWADGNPTDFYTKLFPKMIARAQQVDISGSLTIDDAINRIDNSNRRDAENVTDAVFEEFTQYDL